MAAIPASRTPARARLVVSGGVAAGLTRDGMLAGLDPGMGWLDRLLAAAPGHRPAGIGLIAAMGAAMVAGMMLPVAAPTIATHAEIAARVRERGAAASPTPAFVAGYLAVWAGLCAIAVPAQWWLQGSGLLSAQMTAASDGLVEAVLVAAGLYQASPLKHACLHRCRIRLEFFLTRWRGGWRGALRMGSAHRAFRLGCCSALMALMLALGVMNLVWIGLLAVLLARAAGT